jgi:hypothetical protein
MDGYSLNGIEVIDMIKIDWIRLTMVLGLALAFQNSAGAEDYVFSTGTAQFVVQPNGTTKSFTEKSDGTSELHQGGVPFAVVTQSGKAIPVSSFERQGELYHLVFGASGVTADYRITPSADYIVVEVAAIEGGGIEKLQMVQLSLTLPNGSQIFDARFDDKHTVALMGLSNSVQTSYSGSLVWAAVYPEFGMKGQSVAIVAVPTQQFLTAAQKLEHDFNLVSPPPVIDGKWAKLSPDAKSNYLFTDLTEANVDETIRYARTGGFKYILIYSKTWSGSAGSYPINTASFPHGEAGLKGVIDKCHAAGLKVGMHMVTSIISRNDPWAREGTAPGLLRDAAGNAVPGGGNYLADLKAPLAAAISDRVAGLINRAGFDMIDFDGGEVNGKDGPYWYWVGVQQEEIYKRVKRPLLVTGSGNTPWLWHIFTRGRCEDYAAIGVKDYLDYHKIPDYWKMYHSAFMPADLGWAGLLEDSPDHPATLPDEMEFYATRMLGLDDSVGYETSLAAMKANGRTEEMFKMLASYEQLKESGSVPATVRQQLQHGEWHMTSPGEFHPIRYDEQRVTIPGQVAVKNQFEGQALKFRVQVAPDLKPGGDAIPLVRRALEAEPPAEGAAMPGALVQRVELSHAVNQDSVYTVGPSDRSSAKGFDLTTHRALAVQLTVVGPETAEGEAPVLNLQLTAGGSTFRDYFVDLNFRGTRTVIVAEPGANRTLHEFRPAAANYPFKYAHYSFNYANIAALNVRWMRYPKGSGIHCRIESVEALGEHNGKLKDLEITTGSGKISIPGEMKTGDYAEYWGSGPIRIFDKNGVQLRTVAADGAPQLAAGESNVAIKAAGPGAVKLTAITMGN